MYHCLKTQSRPDRTRLKPTQIRRAGNVPGVIYGKGMASIPVMVPQKELWKFLGEHGNIFEVQIDNGTKHLVSLEKVERDHMQKEWMHVSFHKIKANEKTHVKVPLVFVGSAPGLAAGGLIVHHVEEVEVKGLPKDMPESISVDISCLNLNEHICAKDIKLPPGLELYSEAEEQVVHCALPRREEIPTTPEVPVMDVPVEGEEASAAAPAAAEATPTEKKAS